MNLWRNHSRTIVGLIVGSSIVTAANFLWPDGGNWFDIITLVGGVVLAFGIQGILDACTRETIKPED